MSEPAYPRAYGSWLLLERLGAGGMSEVDLARRAVTEGAFMRFVVIKRIRTSKQFDDLFVRMFQDEARINAELSHENIAQVYDFGREGDEFYMAMEYVPGLDLRAVQLALARKARLLPIRVALSVLVCVLRALQYAHTRVDQLGRPMNIVHRDVNPRNVMLSVNGEVKLIDFGVAKAADRLEKTEGNAVKGKYAYMAPEQVEGSAEVDGRADLFAVALMFHELLTGRSPFSGLSEVQILHRIVSGKIPALTDDLEHPDVPLLRQIHARGLAVRPADRYRNADTFRLDLERALEPLGGPSPALWIGELLREADAPGVAEISRRLREWREGAPVVPTRSIPPPPPAESSGTLNVASIQAPPRGPAWMTLAAAGLGLTTIGLGAALLLIGGAAWLYWPTAPPPPREPTLPQVPPTLEVAVPDAIPASEPLPAVKAQQAPIEGKKPGPSRDSEPSRGAAAVPLPSALPPPEPPNVWTEPLPPPKPAAPAQATGFLNLTSRPLRLEVLLDGVRIGSTPLRLQRVPVGTHTVLVRDAATGRSETRIIVVTADGVVTAPAVILE